MNATVECQRNFMYTSPCVELTRYKVALSYSDFAGSMLRHIVQVVPRIILWNYANKQQSVFLFPGAILVKPYWLISVYVYNVTVFRV